VDPITAAAIQKAYGLIKAGKLEEAQAVLIPLVRTNQNIAEVWYLLGFTLADPQKRLFAFEQVIRIDPANQPAQNQIDKLLAKKSSPLPPAPPPTSPFTSPFTTTSTSPFTVMPDLTDTPAPEPVQEPTWMKRSVPYPTVTDEPAPAVSEPEEPPKRRIHPVFWIGIAVLVVVFIGVGILWIANRSLAAQIPASPSPTPEPPRATSTPGPTPIPTTYAPAFRPAACSFTIPLGTRVRCGSVSVPEYHQKNSGALIELPVVVYQSAKPDADAVLFLQGGPGVESIDWSLALFQDYVKPILADHDMIFFDPRGTGRSQPPLNCPELNTVFIDAYYQNRSQDEAFKDFLNFWSKCHNRFIAEGVDPAAFNTTESAADAYDIVAALGYEKVNLLGISYGTRLGLAIMRDTPEIVRSAVLDSVVPMEGKMFNRRGSDTQYALNKLFSGCIGSTRCHDAYPELAHTFDTLVNEFNDKPATIKVYDPSTGFVSDVKANGVDMLSAVIAGMHNSELVPVVPKAIYDIQKGDYTFLSYALGARGGTYNTTGLGTYFSTVCPEQVYVSTQEELDKDLDVTPLIKQYSLAGLFGSTQNLFELCKAWDAKADDPQEDLPVKSDIPTLVISGQYDPTTPSTTGEMVAKNLPNSHFYIIPGMGHGATIGNECSSTIMMAFLREPEKTPDSSCLEAKLFDFFLPYSGQRPVDLVEMTDNVNGLQGRVPAGWKRKLADAAYFRHAYLFDVTELQVTSFAFSKNIVLDELTKDFQKNGFTGTPQKLDTLSRNGLSWTIYSSKFNGEPVIVALAQVNSTRTVGLIMVVSAPERDAFYKGLFIPVLNSLVSLW
jgi:pimeloyl-ACP methyl ester carboxylesterase